MGYITAYRILVVRPLENEHMRDADGDGKVILKWIVRKCVLVM
jgi:hypothetical protein